MVVLDLVTQQKTVYRTVDPQMIYKKGLEIVSQSHFADDFSRKLLTTVRCLVPLLPEILDNMYIVITCFQARNVIKLF